MLSRLLLHSLTRRRSRKALSIAAVWIGLTLVLALLSLGVDVGDAVSRELRAFGANIAVEPLAAAVPVEVGGHRLAPAVSAVYLDEDRVTALKDAGFFWRNNVTGLSPRLRAEAVAGGEPVELLGVWLDRPVPAGGGETLVTGARQVHPHWSVEGRWPARGDECLAGRAVASRLGLTTGGAARVAVGPERATLTVTGILTTGDADEDALVAPLATVQRLLRAPGKIGGADVAALTTPENRLAEKYRQDPRSLTPDEYDRWSCTPYPGSVAKQIQDAIPGSAARVVRRVSETQGMVFSRTKGLIALLGVVTLVVCGLSVTGIIAASVLERRSEMALLQAIGARRPDVLLLFLVELAVLGLAGGGLAAVTGPLVGAWLVRAVFGVAAGLHAPLVLLSPLLGLGLAWAGGFWPVWQAVNQDPAPVLHGS
jgi:putative ABC transport system permease protein